MRERSLMIRFSYLATLSVLLLLGMSFTSTVLAAPQANQTSTANEQPSVADLPEGFVHLTDITPDIVLDLRYYSTNNFVGARIDGYEAPVGILSRKAAEALRSVDEACKQRGYGLKIYDAYRPQRAVNHFIRWAKDPNDLTQKATFYPNQEKSRLFALGYIASKSGHSRGGTVDLTLVDRATGVDVDMGSPYDFFGPISHHGTRLITAQQAANRNTLKALMQAGGFRYYSKEWWHYTLAKEPFPGTYFNFPIR